MIYHWCPVSVWEASTHTYTPPGFADDGFVHCSYLHQVERTASAHLPGRDGLVLLCIREQGLPVVVEDSHQTGEEYPHVYEPIPLDSVVDVLAFPPEADGSFRLPAGVPAC